MNIGIEKAIKLFFQTTSFPMVFFEAVANAFDASANNDAFLNVLRASIKKSITKSTEENKTSI